MMMVPYVNIGLTRLISYLWGMNLILGRLEMQE